MRSKRIGVALLAAAAVLAGCGTQEAPPEPSYNFEDMAREVISEVWTDLPRSDQDTLCWGFDTVPQRTVNLLAEQSVGDDPELQEHEATLKRLWKEELSARC